MLHIFVVNNDDVVCVLKGSKLLRQNCSSTTAVCLSGYEALKTYEELSRGHSCEHFSENDQSQIKIKLNLLQIYFSTSGKNRRTQTILYLLVCSELRRIQAYSHSDRSSTHTQGHRHHRSYKEHFHMETGKRPRTFHKQYNFY